MAIPAQEQIRVTVPATRVRYWVIFYAVTLAVVTYIDRVAISRAAPAITKDLGLTTVEMGAAFSAFAWAYALFEIPGGFLGDWMGPRKVLMRIVLWWSFFTAATGWVWNFLTLMITRALFGAGEAGCFPNLTKSFTTWLPHHEHGRVPWAKFAASKQVWLLCGQYFCLSYGWYFYITWLPTYLEQGRHVTLGSSAILGGLPLFLGGLGSFVAGIISAPLTRLTGSVTRTRKLLAYTGFTGASGMLLLSSRLENATLAMLAMGLASF